MRGRTDLAIELTTGHKICDGDELISVTDIKIDQKQAKLIGKPPGDYVTIESTIVIKGMKCLYDRLSRAIAKALKRFVSTSQNVLVIGLGNLNLTADALGSKVTENLIITRHIKNDAKNSVSVSAFCPSVMGVTGIESFDIVSGVVEKVKPDLIIAVDSLASAAISRLGAAFQICSSGITPGSGVGNHRKRLDKDSLGASVISLGVPMVVYADIIVAEALKGEPNRDGILRDLDNDICSLIVTPKEIDVYASDCGKVIANAINYAFGLI